MLLPWLQSAAGIFINCLIKWLQDKMIKSQLSHSEQKSWRAEHWRNLKPNWKEKCTLNTFGKIFSKIFDAAVFSDTFSY